MNANEKRVCATADDVTQKYPTYMYTYNTTYI